MVVGEADEVRGGAADTVICILLVSPAGEGLATPACAPAPPAPPACTIFTSEHKLEKSLAPEMVVQSSLLLPLAPLTALILLNCTQWSLLGGNLTLFGEFSHKKSIKFFSK